MKMQSLRSSSPLWRNLVAGAALVILFAGMRTASPILSPILLALFLAVLLYPAYQWLLGRGIPTWLTVSIMVIGVMLVGMGVLALLWLSVAQLTDNLAVYASRLVGLRGQVETWLAILGMDAPALLGPDILNRQMLITTAARMVTNVGSLIFMGFYVLVATVFLLLQSTHLAQRLHREFGPDSPLQAQMVQVAQRTAHFFVIRVRVNLIVAAGITVWLLILGVDLAFLWGILAFFLSFIMYVGLGIAAVPPILLALAETGPLWAVLVIVGVIVINVGVENVLAPAMMGQGLNLAPVVALASLVFWAWILGPLGLILAIPLTVVVVMLLASYPETQWLTVILTMDTPQSGALAKVIDPSPPAPAESAIVEP